VQTAGEVVNVCRFAVIIHRQLVLFRTTTVTEADKMIDVKPLDSWILKNALKEPIYYPDSNGAGSLYPWYLRCPLIFMSHVH